MSASINKSKNIWVSASQINTYFQCPYKWYLDRQKVPGIYIDDTPRRLGIMMHEIITNYFKTVPKQVTEDVIRNTAYKCFEDGFYSDLGHVKEDAEKVIENFILFEINRLGTWEVYHPELVEEPITVKLDNNVYLKGYIDFYCNGTLIDWKTGKFGFLDLDKQVQGSIYNYLTEHKGYDVKEFYFIFLKNNNRYLPLPNISESWILNHINKMVDSVRHGLFPKKENDFCGWCEYQLRCELSQREICLWAI